MKKLSAICQNPWCKAIFFYSENDMTTIKGSDDKIKPKSCNKCKSFNGDMSAGVVWEDRHYDGDRLDNKPHQIKYRVTNFKI
jgi:hypothetical protein